MARDFEVGMARAGCTGWASQTCATHTVAVCYCGEQHSVYLEAGLLGVFVRALC